MGWIEDSIEEFRKLPPAGKLAVGGVTVGVVILAIAQARSSAASGVAASSPSDTTASATPTGAVGTLPSLTTGSPADWANWFNSGLSLPSVPAGAVMPTLPPITWPITAPAAPAASLPAKKVTTPTAPPFRLPNIQNPTAAQTAAHRGTVTTIQNPTAAQTAAHRGTVTTSATPYNTAQQTRLAGALASR